LSPVKARGAGREHLQRSDHPIDKANPSRIWPAILKVDPPRPSGPRPRHRRVRRQPPIRQLNHGC